MSGVESDTDKPVQLCTIQSYSRRLDLDIRAYNRFYINADVIMVDECHRSISKSYRSILEMYYDRIVIGCTATPARADGRGMGEVYNALVDVIGIGELTSKGYLSPVRYFVPSVIDLEGVKIQMGDYQVKSLEKKTNTKKRVKKCLESWIRYLPTKAKCEICEKILFLKGTSSSNTIHFDHKPGSFRGIYSDGYHRRTGGALPGAHIRCALYHGG